MGAHISEPGGLLDMKSIIFIVLLSVLFSSCVIRDALNDWYYSTIDKDADDDTATVIITIDWPEEDDL